jgi:uncharacterized protein (TIGR02246 family)
MIHTINWLVVGMSVSSPESVRERRGQSAPQWQSATVGPRSNAQAQSAGPARRFRASLVATSELFVHPNQEGVTMRKIALAIAFLAWLIAPALAQKAEIEAGNAKWIELFNKGDFAGVASLYTEDATVFPPGAAMVKGREAIGALWKGFAEQVTDPKLTTLDVKSFGPSAAREIGTVSLKTKSATPQEVAAKYVVLWEKVGDDWKIAIDIWNDGK